MWLHGVQVPLVVACTIKVLTFWWWRPKNCCYWMAGWGNRRALHYTVCLIYRAVASRRLRWCIIWFGQFKTQKFGFCGRQMTLCSIPELWVFQIHSTVRDFPIFQSNIGIRLILNTFYPVCISCSSESVTQSVLLRGSVHSGRRCTSFDCLHESWA